MSKVIGCAFCECDIEGMHHDLDCPNHPDYESGGPDAVPPKECPTCGKLDNPFCSDIYHPMRDGHVYKDGVLQPSDAAQPDDEHRKFWLRSAKWMMTIFRRRLPCF